MSLACAWIVSIPIRSRKRRPISTAGRLRKSTVPSSKCAAPGADWYQSRWTKAATIVPPENQGRSSLAERLAAGEQRADAGRPAEHLVERERHEVGVPAGEVEPVGRDERGGVEQHVPAGSWASSIHSSGCWTPEKFDWAG